MNFIKNYLFILLMCTGIGGPVMAETYSFRVSLSDKVSTWESADSVYGEWTVKDYNCGEWTPKPDSVEFGQSYLQSRTCLQDEVRNVTLREFDSSSQAYRSIGTETEERSVNVIENQNETGTLKKWEPYASNFSEWENEGEPHTFGDWSPSHTTQTETFGQIRSFQQDQFRMEQPRERDSVTGDLRDVGEPIKRTQTVSNQENRQVFVEGIAWIDTMRTEQGEWAPVSGNQVEDYTQYRTYTQNQSRSLNYYVANGDSIGTHEQTQALTGQTQNQSIVVTVSNWTNSGVHYACGTWSPEVSTVNYGENFTQNRSCSQDQTRTYTHKLGTNTVHTRDVTQTISETESQSATGTKQNWVATTSTFTEWVNSGGQTNLGAWTPAVASQTANFTQTQSYDQSQTRNEQQREQDTITLAYRNVGNPIARSRTISEINTRTVTVTAGAWANTTTAAFTAWTPAYGSQTANYTQTRTYTQNQSRTWNYVANNDSIGTRAETQALTGRSDSRIVTVIDVNENNYIQLGEPLDGYDVGDPYNYTTWFPVESTVEYGKEFQQSRRYTQKTISFWVHRVDNTKVHRHERESFYNEYEYRTATGTKLVWSKTIFKSNGESAANLEAQGYFGGSAKAELSVCDAYLSEHRYFFYQNGNTRAWRQICLPYTEAIAVDRNF